MSAHAADVIVVGAGIIGSMTAYYLSHQNKVLIIEKATPCSGASGACNSGLSYLGKEGVQLERAVQSLLIYKNLPDELQAGLDLNQERRMLLLAENEDELKVLADRVDACRSSGMPGELLSRKKVEKEFPKLAGSFLGGALAAGGLHGYVNPFKVVAACLRKIQEAGGKLLRHEKVKSILLEKGQVAGVQTGKRVVRAPVVVICSGHEADNLLDPLNPVGLKPVQGTILITERTPLDPGAKIFSAAFLQAPENFAISLAVEKTSTNNILIGTSREMVSKQGPARTTILELAHKAHTILPDLKKINVLRVITGIRAVRSGGPFIGPVPGCTGLYASLGHGGEGITIAPQAGRELAKIIGSVI